MKSYSELINFESYEERLKYLQSKQPIGYETFGGERYINQVLYNSSQWKKVRDQIIVRDNCCDLGVDGYAIFDKPIIHHINSITIEQVKNRDPIIFDPENLITVSHRTHNAIHYSDERPYNTPVERRKGDTTPWKQVF